MEAPLHFIIIDDDFTNNLICQYLFKKANDRASVKIFTEPGKGLSFIEKEYNTSADKKPTVLLLDINMPGMTGWEFLDIFNKFPEALKSQFHVFILSSSREDFSREKDRYPEVYGFLSKPFTKDKVDIITEKIYERSDGLKAQ